MPISKLVLDHRQATRFGVQRNKSLVREVWREAIC